VTEDYFGSRREPQGPQAIKMAIALHGRKSAGVRLLTLKGKHNDPMTIMYFALRGRNLHGTAAALNDRLAIEARKGNLTKTVGRKIGDDISEPALPEHDSDYARLMS
jgi:hypothetical protein